MFKNNFEAICWLLILGYASSAIGKHHKSFFDEKTEEACMTQLNVTEQQVQAMDDATEPNTDYNCFFGCAAINDGLITANGQLNSTYATAALAAAKNDDQKAKLQEFFHEFDEDLKARATDACSAGGIIQKYAYKRRTNKME